MLVLAYWSMLFYQVGITQLHYVLTNIFNLFQFTAIQFQTKLCLLELIIRINSSRVLSITGEHDELGL